MSKEEEGGGSVGVGVGVGVRRGGMMKKKMVIGVRAWLVIDMRGGTRVVEAGKHSIMKSTGLPARDLRILDPLLSYPSTILGRERAIVINVEHIKAIITAHEVLLLNSTDPFVAPFVSTLQRRILSSHSQSQPPSQTHGSDEIGDGDNEDSSKAYKSYRYEVLGHRQNDSDDSQKLSYPEEADSRSQVILSSNLSGPTALPFEFLALEACLEAACGCLDAETEKLENEAYPALDELTIKISTLNLERVRQLKSRLVAISARVQAVRDELEKLLDDDEDMSELYLTDKLMRQHLEEVKTTTVEEVPPFSRRTNDRHSDNEEESYGASQEWLPSTSNLQRKFSRCSSGRTNTATSKSNDIEELEMLLEAYFVQTDGILNKLSTLREYADDTEDYINIMLDDKQNHLLQMGVMMTTGTLVMSIFVVVTAIFGMNIQISLFEKGGLPEFLWVIAGTGSGVILTYILVIAWCKHKRLLE